MDTMIVSAARETRCVAISKLKSSEHGARKKEGRRKIVRTHSAFAGILALGGAALIAPVAHAGLMNVELKVNGVAIWNDDLGTTSDGMQSGSSSYNNPSWVDLQYVNVTWDSDPSISYDFSLQNVTAAPQRYTLVFSTNVNPALTNPFGLEMNGSVSGGGLDTGTNDAFGSGAAVGGVGGASSNWAHGWIPSGDSHYRAYIDGNLVRTLLDDPQADGQNHLLWWGGQFSTPSYGPASFGQPVPEITPGPALVDMRLEIDFWLSEGDFFTSNGYFEVVPAPGAIGLLGIAGLAGRGRRRR
jgi:hypothetical protein